MVHGVVFSAMIGGVTGLISAILGDQPIMMTLTCYPLGGLLSVAVFLLVTNLRCGLDQV